MKYCPITYEAISENEKYSKKGLKLLSSQLKALKPLPLSTEELRTEAISRAGKMSIQGVQTKLSAQLKIKEEGFSIVDYFGHYILKPPSQYYPELPENEAISMTLAANLGIETPLHGLIDDKDGNFTYFIKRFDRIPHKNKLLVEDFAQLSEHTRETKYDSSMEKVAKIIASYCTFPKVENVKLLKLVLFNFLIGNEDMHLKNFSLITHGKITSFSPAYDLLNTTIAQKNTKEELALPLNGKKNHLKSNDFLDYYAIKVLEINPTVVTNMLKQIQQIFPTWQKLIRTSFLSLNMQDKYLDLLEERYQRLLIKTSI